MHYNIDFFFEMIWICYECFHFNNLAQPYSSKPVTVIFQKSQNWTVRLKSLLRSNFIKRKFSRKNQIALKREIIQMTYPFFTIQKSRKITFSLENTLFSAFHPEQITGIEPNISTAKHRINTGFNNFRVAFRVAFSINVKVLILKRAVQAISMNGSLFITILLVRTHL